MLRVAMVLFLLTRRLRLCEREPSDAPMKLDVQTRTALSVRDRQTVGLNRYLARSTIQKTNQIRRTVLLTRCVLQ